MKQTFGQWLKFIRLQRKWSLRELAQKAGVGRSTLSDWESERSLPRLAELDALLNVFTVSAKEKREITALIATPRTIQRLRSEQIALPSPLEATVGTAPTAGDLLRAMRRRKKWTLEQTALKIGVPHSTVSRWERGIVQPSSEKLQALCYALGASESELVMLTCQREALWQYATEPPSLENTVERFEVAQKRLTHLDEMHSLDLYCLDLEARLWFLAAREPSDSHVWSLLGQVYAFYAQRLANLHRFEESRSYAERCSTLLSRHFASTPAYAVGLINVVRSETRLGYRAPIQGAEAYHRQLNATAESDYRSWLMMLIAMMLGKAGYSERALEFARQSGQQTTLDGILASTTFEGKISTIRLLISVGRLQEASAGMAAFGTLIPLDRFTCLLNDIELKLAKKQFGAARECYQETLTHMEKHNLHAFHLCLKEFDGRIALAT